MPRRNLAQRIVLVVALGVTLLTAGDWFVGQHAPRTVPEAWIGYAPLAYTPNGRPLKAAGVLLVWLGLAAVWTVVSLWLLRSVRSRTDDQEGDDS